MQEFDFDNIFREMSKISHSGEIMRKKESNNSSNILALANQNSEKISEDANGDADVTEKVEEKQEVSATMIFFKLLIAAALVILVLNIIDNNFRDLNYYSGNYTSTIGNNNEYKETYYVRDGKLTDIYRYLDNKALTHDSY